MQWVPTLIADRLRSSCYALALRKLAFRFQINACRRVPGHLLNTIISQHLVVCVPRPGPEHTHTQWVAVAIGCAEKYPEIRWRSLC